MLRPREGSLLYHLARDYFRGHGEMIDLGVFLGASSYCLASGLEENVAIAKKAGRLHAYDLFEVWHEEGQTDEEMAADLQRIFGVDIRPNESTLPLYMANVGALGRYIRIHAGDILPMKWSGRPVEILFVDICKTRSIWQHVLAEFFPSLIPGVSLVIHQDYHHPLLPFLHVAQERLAPYFEIVEPKANDSAAFLLVDRIPDRVLAEVAGYEFSAEDELRLMDRAIERMPEDNKHLELAKAMLLRQQGKVGEARALLEAVKSRAAQYHKDRHFPLYAGMTEWYIDRDEQRARG
jgi:hypothetical protein